jgi:hypothetical protein
VSFVTLIKQAIAAVAPSAGRGTLHLDADGRPTVTDSAGHVTVSYAAERSLLRNGAFRIVRRQVPGTLTTYSSVGGRIVTADGWDVSNENASVQFRRVDKETAAEVGVSERFHGEWTKLTATGKFLVCQALESRDVIGLRGRTIRVQLKARAIVTGAPFAIALVSWSGAVDTLSRAAAGFVTAWGANGVAPTLAANYAYVGPTAGRAGDNCTAVPGGGYLATLTTTWQRFGGSFTVPAGAKNLLVVVYSLNQVAAASGLALAEVSLTPGEAIVDWSPIPFQSDLDACARHYSKSFALETAPAQNAGVATGAVSTTVTKAAAVALAATWHVRHATELRAVPTVVLFGPGSATAQARRITGAAAADQAATAIANNTAKSLDITCTGDALGVVGDQVVIHFTADAEL